MASIRKLPSGNYRVRWRDAAGNERGATAPTKKAALELKAQAELNAFRGLHRDPKAGRRALGPYLEELLNSSGDLRPATLALYRTEAERYVLPRFGGTAMSSIEPADIRRFYADLQKRSVGVPTIEVVHRLLSRTFVQAVNDDMLPSNPVARVKVPKAERKPIVVMAPREAIWIALALEVYVETRPTKERSERERWLLTWPGVYWARSRWPNGPESWRLHKDGREGEAQATLDQALTSARGWAGNREIIDDLLTAAWLQDLDDPATDAELMQVPTNGRSSDGLGVMALLAMFAGLRFGEAAALRLSRVQLGESPRVQVLDALTEVGSRVSIGPPKTPRSLRSVPIPEALAAMIDRHIREALPARAEHLRKGRSTSYEDMLGSDPLLFTTPQGHPLSRTRFAARRWNPAVRLLGLEPAPTFHDLRHSYAAWLINQGAHAKEIQELMGHASIRTTLDVYGHLMETLESAQHVRMNAALGEARGTYVARQSDEAVIG